MKSIHNGERRGIKMKLYTELNAQEKFKRTVRTIPFCIIVILILLFVGERDPYSVVSAIVISVMSVVQLIYTYKKAKENQ